MPNVTPRALTSLERVQLAEIETLRDMWGASSVREFADMLLNDIYAVHFDFISGGPGYCGDLYLLTGDNLDDGPVKIIRRNGEFVLL